MKTRLYAVTVVVGDTRRDHLVDAASVNTAKSHVAAKYVQGAIADGKTVQRLMAQGVAMESAVADPNTQELQQS